MGTPLPLPKRGADPPNFRPMFIATKTAGWMKLALGMEIGLSPGDFVLDGDPAPPPKRAPHSPQFSAHFYCGQMAAYIKMPLGIELGLGPGDFVLDGDPASSLPKGHRPPIFGPYLLRPNGCIDQDVTWYGARPRPRRLCVR